MVEEVEREFEENSPPSLVLVSGQMGLRAEQGEGERVRQGKEGRGGGGGTDPLRIPSQDMAASGLVRSSPPLIELKS